MENSSRDLLMNLFRAPAAARAAKTLDKSLFTRTLPTSVAALTDNRLIAKYRIAFEKTKELLLVERVNTITSHPNPDLAARGKKCLILDPKVKPNEPQNWSTVLQEASKLGEVTVQSHDVVIEYDIWSYLDVMKSILPEELNGEIPTGFNTAGHIAHLNLRSQYLPYRHVIAQVILDKNPGVKTVINKTDNVGNDDEFRTFGYEVLAGPNDMLVETSEANCVFKFDYSKVYWNSKLGTEHHRIASFFKPGEVVVDVMAGIGPFAVPAGKNGVFVWANDKNPESYKWLQEAIKRNKVHEYVRPFNDDGHDFIQKSADMVLQASRNGDHALIQPAKVSRSAQKTAPRPQPTKVLVPPTISHFVMNLPASAIEFLHNYRGLYHGHEELFTPHTETKLPMVHVHCFALKADDNRPLEDICQRIHKEIGILFSPGDSDNDGEVSIHEVRDVAPAKRMFCASFRLPPRVAFAARS